MEKLNIGDIVKLMLKFLTLLSIGLLISIVIYPFLHETGHSVAILLFGGEIINFEIMPVPYVLCQITDNSETEFVIIGVFGMLFPYIVSFFVPTKNFWLCYVKTTIRLICFLSFVLSIVSVYLYQKGSQMQNDDITTILQNSPNSLLFCSISLVFLSISSFILLIKDINNLKRMV